MLKKRQQFKITSFVKRLPAKKRNYLRKLVVVVVVITPPLSRDGGTARTLIQVHAVNLIEIRLGERWQSISNQSWRKLVAIFIVTLPLSKEWYHGGKPWGQRN